jgi:hypothetical protein
MKRFKLINYKFKRNDPMWWKIKYRDWLDKILQIEGPNWFLIIVKICFKISVG